MAASMALRREFCSLTRILSGISSSVPPVLGSCAAPKKCFAKRSPLPLTQGPSFHTAAAALSSTVSSPITITDQPDTLFQKVTVLVKGHDWAVLDSYEYFATMAAKELGITVSNVFEPPKDIERLTVLKSVHIFKKHRVQYEMRTHYRCIELSHLTGSTAQVYLEYIQRNLPESIAMQVTKIAMEKVPDHITEPMWKDEPTEEAQKQPSQ
ncbi:probable 28S ribosomal protein S10, mitochondrial [Dunckerocampus dactyliophorus]|uniref:probable 28S ribosomal protein S10, mitochondrial n=1 Tax=Dunckerocampus dactyliophorus TaxID=161453 RepID=UPI00240539DF|nr:probable 28S ribosomal protein S10, mitochondrial [Dunckerocampus dactyliophorus]